MLLPFKHSVRIKLQLENRNYEQSRLLMVHSLQSSQMLLHSIMQSPQFLSRALFQRGSFKYHSYMSLMYQSGAIKLRLDSLSIVFPKTGQTLNGVLS